MANAIGAVAFCENGDCQVILFQIAFHDAIDDVDEPNCPSCGRFGAIKDLPKLQEGDDSGNGDGEGSAAAGGELPEDRD